jgi:CheY-like chemotaxis protein
MIQLLYIDDSRIALKMMQKYLSDFAEVHCVTTISEALAFLQKNEVSGFIVDYKLSGECGFDLIETLRKTDAHRETPIFLISASLTEEVAYEAMKRGVNSSYKKPIADVDELKTNIQNMIKTPRIDQVYRNKISINCLKWQEGGVYYEFSPELRKLVSGTSLDQVDERMLEAVKENNVKALGEIYGVEIVQHQIMNPKPE